MSAIYVLEYILGLGVFGFMYWLLDSIQHDISVASTKGDVFNFLGYAWTGLIIVYLIFGGIWLVRKYNEREYYNGY